MSLFDLTDRHMINIVAKETAYFSRLPDKSGDYSILRVAHERWGPGTNERREDYHIQSIVVVVSGEGSFSDGKQTWPLRSGSAFFFGPGSPHLFSNWPGQELEIYIIDSAGKRSSTIARECVGSMTTAVTPSNPHVVLSAIEHLYSVARANLPFAHRTCVLLLQALWLSIRAGLTPGLRDTSRAEASYFTCRGFIDQHFKEMTSTADAAEAAHVSHAYMCRLFKRYTSVSPQVYLSRLKMNLAAHLLLTSGEPVKSISNQLGYADQYTFSKCFKRLMRMAPQHYRDRLTAGPE